MNRFPAPSEPLAGGFGVHGFFRLEDSVVLYYCGSGTRARLHQSLLLVRLWRGVAGLIDGVRYGLWSIGPRGGWIRAIGIVRSAGFVLRVVFRLGVVGGFQKVPFELTGMLLGRRSQNYTGPIR